MSIPALTVRGPVRAFPSAIHDGMNLRESLAHARRLGASVVHPRRTGEVRLQHPLMPKPVLANSRRKDSPRKVTAWLRRLEIIVAGQPGAAASVAA